MKACSAQHLKFTWSRSHDSAAAQQRQRQVRRARVTGVAPSINLPPLPQPA